jgi:hypothetical protein
VTWYTVYLVRISLMSSGHRQWIITDNPCARVPSAPRASYRCMSYFFLPLLPLYQSTTLDRQKNYCV